MPESSEVPERFARVGRRFHLVTTEPAYTGQPQVALCGSVFIRNPEGTEGLPSCAECFMLEVDRMRHEADQMLERANDLTLALNKQYAGSPER